MAVYRQTPGFLKLTATDGEGAFNDMQRKTGHPPAIRVLDKSNNAVLGAVVTFTMPTIEERRAIWWSARATPQLAEPSLSGLLSQAILVVQPAEGRRRFDTVTGGKLVPLDAGRHLGLGWLRDART